MMRRTCAPSLVCCSTFHRKMSPTLIWTRSKSTASSLACVPLPLPCTPMITYLRMVSRLLSSALGRLAVGTGQHDGIAVVVSKPDLAVSRAAGPLGWVAVGREDDLGLELARALDGGVEVIDLEPQQYAVAVGRRRRIADGAVVVLHVPVVQLHDEGAVGVDEALVLGTAVIAPDAEKALVPPAARLDVVHGDQRLGAHIGSW